MDQVLAIFALNRAGTHSHAGLHKVLNFPSGIPGWESQQGLKQLDHPNPQPQPHRPAKRGENLCDAEGAIVPAGDLHLVGKGDVDGGVGHVLLHLVQEVRAPGG